MATKTQTRSGTCPTHGTVEAVRQVPGPSFPFIVYGIRRAVSASKPFLCPDCGQPVK
ncbi:MAG TPA: hypothetical protein VFW71_04215 [Actinomycetota bacterium]|nr:hypothetical protein [Actinomycetota bacterium]